MGSRTITERVYLDAHGKATTDEAKADRLWATPGLDVTDEEIARVGYVPGISDGESEISYRDLQAKARAMELPAGGSREVLEARIAEAESATRPDA